MHLPETRPRTMTFSMPRAGQWARAAHLEAAFRAYARDLGCTIIHDEIETYSERQAMLLRNWWMEHGL